MKSKALKTKDLAKKAFDYMMKGYERSYALALAGCKANIVLAVNEELDIILRRWRGEL